ATSGSRPSLRASRMSSILAAKIGSFTRHDSYVRGVRATSAIASAMVEPVAMRDTTMSLAVTMSTGLRGVTMRGSCRSGGWGQDKPLTEDGFVVAVCLRLGTEADPLDPFTSSRISDQPRSINYSNYWTP